MLTWVKNNRFASRILTVKLLLAFCVFTLYPLEVDAGRVRVRGYYRKDGTYVRPHYRTAPDGNPYNNYSFPGNYNPNTGRITPGDPFKYLDRYYNGSSYRYSSVDYEKFLKDLGKRTQVSGDVNVRGYYRKDGSYVTPHIRTSPDGNPYNNYSYSGSSDSNTRKITSARSSRRNLVGVSFKVGSTEEEVVSILGKPNWFTDTVYSYGLSRVYFRNGRVTSWYSSPSEPLHSKLATATPVDKTNIKGDRVTSWYSSSSKPLHPKLAAATPTNKTHITVGSTEGEVVFILGKPNWFTDTVYSYGLSRVYFRNGRVTSWYSSPANPLKVR